MNSKSWRIIILDLSKTFSKTYVFNRTNSGSVVLRHSGVKMGGNLFWHLASGWLTLKNLQPNRQKIFNKSFATLTFGLKSYKLCKSTHLFIAVYQNLYHNVAKLNVDNSSDWFLLWPKQCRSKAHPQVTNSHLIFLRLCSNATNSGEISKVNL